MDHGECIGKRKHRSKDKAEKEARRRRNLDLNGGTYLATYQCKICHFWHVGATFKKKQPYKRDKKEWL